MTAIFKADGEGRMVAGTASAGAGSAHDANDGIFHAFEGPVAIPAAGSRTTCRQLSRDAKNRNNPKPVAETPHA
ncbi:MAG TPA: hypothetical protein VF254_06565 [Gammaproteobacteria bacterium]